MEQGLRLVNINALGMYYFVEDDSNSKIVRTDFREFNRRKEFKEYVSFMEDTGWQLLKGSYLFGQHYFIGDKSNGNIELFSDNESKAALYKRREKSIFIGWLMLLILLFTYVNKLFSLGALFSHQIYGIKQVRNFGGLFSLNCLLLWGEQEFIT